MLSWSLEVVFDGDIAASDDVGVDNVAAAILDEDSGVSWLCVDSNPQSPSFGAAWPAPAAVAQLYFVKLLYMVAGFHRDEIVIKAY